MHLCPSSQDSVSNEDGNPDFSADGLEYEDGFEILSNVLDYIKSNGLKSTLPSGPESETRTGDNEDRTVHEEEQILDSLSSQDTFYGESADRESVSDFKPSPILSVSKPNSKTIRRRRRRKHPFLRTTTPRPVLTSTFQPPFYILDIGDEEIKKIEDSETELSQTYTQIYQDLNAPNRTRFGPHRAPIVTAEDAQNLANVFEAARTNPYIFLLGVVPLTLTSLFVLGHNPFQILIIGAYMVTVYLLKNGLEKLTQDLGDSGEFSTSFERSDDPLLPFPFFFLDSRGATRGDSPVVRNLLALLFPHRNGDELTEIAELLTPGVVRRSSRDEGADFTFSFVLNLLRESIAGAYFSDASFVFLEYLSRFADERFKDPPSP